MTFATLPISCFIRTLNEERMIGDVITSAKKIAGEVVIVDSGSKDRTLEIAAELGAEIVKQDWLGNGHQKRIGEDVAKHDWVLDIDADEIVSDEMVAEIHTLFAEGAPQVAALLTPLITVPPVGKPWKNFGLAYRYKMYDKTKIRIPADYVWDQFSDEGIETQSLNNGLLHYSFDGVELLMAKFNRGSGVRARNAKPRSLPMHLARIWFAYPLYFFKKFVIKRMFMAGTYGFAVSRISATGRWLRDVKQYEIYLKSKETKDQK